MVKGMKNKTKNITLTGLAASLIAVLSVWQIPMPLGVPLTLQVFAVAFCAYTLGAGRAFFATAVYIVLGAVGLPVFSGFQGGAAVLFGPCGGFIAGFLPLCLLCGAGRAKRAALALLFGALGLLLCHAAGCGYYAFVTKTPLFESFLSASLPFIPKDAVLLSAAYFLSVPVKRRIGI